MKDTLGIQVTCHPASRGALASKGRTLPDVVDAGSTRPGERITFGLVIEHDGMKQDIAVTVSNHGNEKVSFSICNGSPSDGVDRSGRAQNVLPVRIENPHSGNGKGRLRAEPPETANEPVRTVGECIRHVFGEYDAHRRANSDEYIRKNHRMARFWRDFAPLDSIPVNPTVPCG